MESKVINENYLKKFTSTTSNATAIMCKIFEKH